MKNQGMFYISIALIFGIALWFVLIQGAGLEKSGVDTPSVTENSTQTPTQQHFFSNLEKNIHHPLAILVIQIFSIMIVARIFGHLMTRMGQPSVVGEILAGIALGPSLMGLFFPEFSTFLFPEESLPRLHVLSQIGLVLFMFIIGIELDIRVLKEKAKSAIIISHASIIFPYFLGVALAYFLYSSFASPHIPFTAFALFMGIAMSITAFPVLARIVQERNLMQKPLGTIVITCAAADDITAWCLLAVVVAIVRAGGLISAIGSIVLSIIYILFMWFVVKPLLHRIAIKYDTPESISKSVVAAIFGILLLSSYLTEVIGIHALFGAFLAGVIMPAQKDFKRILSEKIEDISLVLLLPLFFVFTGLRTQIGLLNQPDLWMICLLIIGVAVLGKFAGSAIAAKFVGQSWKDSLLIGALMNTRGLMELIVLNIGYDMGVISPTIFTMMVIMALLTTFMTGPTLSIIEFFFGPKVKQKKVSDKEGINALISFGSPHSGSRLLEVAYYLNLRNEKDSSITVAHFSPSADISFIEAEQHEKDAFGSIYKTAEKLDVSLKSIFRVTDNVEKEIFETINEEESDMILVGSSRELFRDDKTGGKVRSLFHHAHCATGVFVDFNFRKIENVLLVLNDDHDSFLFKYAERFLKSDATKSLTLLDLKNRFSSKEEVLKIAGKNFGENFILCKKLEETGKRLEEYDIAVISLNFWESLKKPQNTWMNPMPSLLIINR